MPGIRRADDSIRITADDLFEDFHCKVIGDMRSYSQDKGSRKTKSPYERKDSKMSNDRKNQILIAGLKAGKDGFALKQQLASLANILKQHKVADEVAESILEEAGESGIMNASQTLQDLKKKGIIAVKVDESLKKMFMDALK